MPAGGRTGPGGRVRAGGRTGEQASAGGCVPAGGQADRPRRAGLTGGRRARLTGGEGRIITWKSCSDIRLPLPPDDGGTTLGDRANWQDPRESVIRAEDLPYPTPTDWPTHFRLAAACLLPARHRFAFQLQVHNLGLSSTFHCRYIGDTSERESHVRDEDLADFRLAVFKSKDIHPDLWIDLLISFVLPFPPHLFFPLRPFTRSQVSTTGLQSASNRYVSSAAHTDDMRTLQYMHGFTH